MLLCFVPDTMIRNIDDDSSSHLQRQQQHRPEPSLPSSPLVASHHLGGGDQGSVDAGGGGGATTTPSSCFDPCHMSSNTNCIAALESSVDHMTMGCGSLPLTDFSSRFRPMPNYFNHPPPQ